SAATNGVPMAPLAPATNTFISCNLPLNSNRHVSQNCSQNPIQSAMARCFRYQMFLSPTTQPRLIAQPETLCSTIGAGDPSIMKRERWRQIEQLYHAALEQEPMRQEGFLTEACQGDAELRREVESLLAQSGSNGALVDHSAWAAAAGTSTTETILKSRDTLGPYRILGLLGGGGMSEVDLAVDNRLGRKVAIKICQEQFGARFEREARLISALNHPNICTLYDVGSNYLVMELVEGETLRDLLKRALPVERSLDIA